MSADGTHHLRDELVKTLTEAYGDGMVAPNDTRPDVLVLSTPGGLTAEITVRVLPTWEITRAVRNAQRRRLGLPEVDHVHRDDIDAHIENRRGR